MSLFWRAVCLFVIIYSVPSFSDNPPVITAVCLIMLFFITLFGTEEVDLYHDRLIQKDFSLFSLMTGSQRRIIFYDEVDSFSMQPYISETSEGLAYIILRALTKNRRASPDNRDILITWKNGRVEHVTTALGEEIASEIVDCANELLKEHKRRKQK